MALGKKYADVYDNIKNLTPMARMLQEQAARQKVLEEQQKEEDGNSKSSNRKSRTNSGTSK